MKHAAVLLFIFLGGFPAMFIGYIWQHIVIGFETGRDKALDHANALADEVEKIKSNKTIKEKP